MEMEFEGKIVTNLPREAEEQRIVRKDDKVYLIQVVPDKNQSNPFEEWNGLGEIVVFSRRYCGQSDCERAVEMLKDKHSYAIPLDAYIHGGVHVSVANTRDYPDRQWDVCGGAWLPEKCCLEEIHLVKGKERERAIEMAKQACNLYNMVSDGDCWGIVTYELLETEDAFWVDDKNDDAVWGYWGYKYAIAEAFGDPVPA